MALRSLALFLVVAAPVATAAAQPYAYALVSGGAREQSGVYVTEIPPRIATIDAAKGEVVSSVPLAGCVAPAGFALAPGGRRVFVACSGMFAGGSVVEVDLDARAILRTLALASAPVGIAVTPDGTTAVVSLNESRNGPGGVSLVDLSRFAVTATFPFTRPGRPAVLPDGSRAYVPGFNEPYYTLMIVDIAPASSRTLVLSGLPLALGVAGNGSRVVVSTRWTGLAIVDTATDTIEAYADVKGPPMISSSPGYAEVAVDATGSRAYVPIFGTPEDPASTIGVRIIDLNARTVAGTLASAQPFQVALSPAETHVHVSTPQGMPPGRVETIDMATGQSISLTPVIGTVIQLLPVPAGITPPIDACEYAVSVATPRSGGPPLPLSHPQGSAGRLAVIALPDRCAWTAQSNAPWIALDAAGGSGTRTVGYSIARNNSGAARTGAIVVGDYIHQVAQAACSNPIVVIDSPTNGELVSQPYRASGWAIDTCAANGSGIKEGEPGVVYGLPRPDIAAAFGSQFLHSGFTTGLGEDRAGFKTLQMSFRSAVTNDLHHGRVSFTLRPPGAPFGSLDTPADNVTVAGELPVTGWALDDVGMLGPILVYRNAVEGEAPTPGPDAKGRVLLGTAVRVAGARPEIAQAFPSNRDKDVAGFGLMVLTNMLPNGGNGPFTFTADVTDGLFNTTTLTSTTLNTTTLGPKSVMAANAGSLAPFGTIDTPTQGQTVSGTITNFGWALSPSEIPTHGSTISVYIDNVFVGHPSYNHVRADIAALFPGYPNTSDGKGAIGYFQIDTTKYANGVHTISWVVIDSAGRAQGIGSRYFTIANP